MDMKRIQKLSDSKLESILSRLDITRAAGGYESPEDAKMSQDFYDTLVNEQYRRTDERKTK